MPVDPDRDFKHFDWEVLEPAVMVLTFKETSFSDQGQRNEMVQEIFSVVDKLGWQRIVLDFKYAIEFPRIALGILTMTFRKVSSVYGELVFCGFDPPTRQLLVTTNLDSAFEVRDNLGQAMSFFT